MDERDEIAEEARARARRFTIARPPKDDDEPHRTDDEQLGDRMAENPELGLAMLLLGPLLPLVWIYRKLVVQEAEHDSLRFKLHDWMVRHPEAGFLVGLGAALLYVLAMIGLVAAGITASSYARAWF